MTRNRNSEYWQKRYKLVEERLYKYAFDNRVEIEKIFKNSLANINKDIAVWLQRFADNNNITYAEATRLIGTKELEELGWDVKKYIEKGIDNQYTRLWDKELENASARWHISRLEALKLQVINICENMYGSVENVISDTMKKVYTEGYYRSSYELSKGLNIGINVAKVNESLLQKIISKPWADDGSNFSERIWGKYRPTLVNRLHKDLTDCVIRGINPHTLAAQYAKEFKVSENAASNLLLTEYSQFAAQSNMDCLNDLGVEEYEIIETLDGKTCETCREMDKKHFLMSQRKIGVNAPPFHPRCRGTTCPYFDDEFTTNIKRAARDKDGNTVYVNDMSYKEWKEKFVKEKGQDTWDYYEQSTKNKNTDMKQYKKYKSVLGKNAPKSLKEFQKLKYLDHESYRYVKLDYKRRNTLLENPELKLPNSNKAIVDDKKFSGYLFNTENSVGFAKGKAFTSRLGYDIINYKDLQKEIIYSASRYPAVFKDNNGYGNRYEQKIILYGNKGKPANVVIGWLCNDGGTKMTSAYIKEV